MYLTEFTCVDKNKIQNTDTNTNTNTTRVFYNKAFIYAFARSVPAGTPLPCPFALALPMRPCGVHGDWPLSALSPYFDKYKIRNKKTKYKNEIQSTDADTKHKHKYKYKYTYKIQNTINNEQ